MVKYTSSVNFKILLQGFLLLQLVKDRSVRVLQYTKKKKKKEERTKKDQYTGLFTKLSENKF